MRLSFSILVSLLALVDALSVAPRAAVEIKPIEQSSQHWKRRGGGGGGGGRGGGGGGSSSGGSSSGGGGGRGSSSSNAGGRTTTGSGAAPSYGGGRFYGGGATVPYKAGGRSPSGISPVFLGVGLGALAFWPGLWLYGAYTYPYSRPYGYYNQTSRQNETAEVTCGCDPYSVCGCDENGDPQFLSDIIGNGTDLNNTLVSVATINNTRHILLNGTLPNGTTAAGGDEDPFGNASQGMRRLLENAGFWPVVALVATMVFTA
ncbi:hypothetical protein B0T14DRAFT_559505 [Immersiella caudata]|uniref:DUF7732 domain-containing protein n=1 Tax=Immersiella caudata TaxID=314043 RepID=A0AA40CBX0_9PEZI|nr:hypothetical protein B0T14DRAFT_559505 [Immersiella caudata]